MDHIESFETELREYCDSVVGCLVLGDLNIHHQRWLRYSNANTREGDRLRSICQLFDLKQLVDQPTRENYLLDLCLTDIDRSKVKRETAIADHPAILVTCPLSVNVSCKSSREVWLFKAAK